MPQIKKPEKTGIPVIDYLYSTEPDISPAPIVPAITREALLRATKEALPPLNSIYSAMRNMMDRSLVNALIQLIPKKHLEPIKSVEVLPSYVVKALSSSDEGIVTGLYLPESRTILLARGIISPTTPIHEVGHDVFHYANPRYIERVLNTYLLNPNLPDKLSKYTNVVLDNPAELFAEAYAQNLLRSLGNPNARNFFYAIPREIRNIPFQIKPYRGALD